MPERSASWGRRGPTAASGSGSRRRPFLRRRHSLVPRVDGDAQSLVLNATLVPPTFAADGLTNGKQISAGSCNAAPMGEVPTTSNLPSVRSSRQMRLFSLSIAVNNLHTGVFTNPNETFLAAPQQLDASGFEIDVNSTAPMDPRDFAFFTLVSDAADDFGDIAQNIPGGLPEGYYRVTATTRASNHQPVLPPLAQTGSMDDVVYITVTADGSPGSTPQAKTRRTTYDMGRRHTPLRKPSRIFGRDDAQSSLTLLSKLVASGFQNNGMDTLFQAGQSASATSSNNFINFCGSSTLPLIKGSASTAYCNPAPMGLLPATNKMPSARITYPHNGDVLLPNMPMTVGVAVANFATGNSANSDQNYASAPQQLDADGLVEGHPYILFEALTSPTQSNPTNPVLFVLTQSLPHKADETGVVTTSISLGMPTGTSNGVPVLVPVLEHGAIGDAIYFTVAPGGSIPTNQTAIIGARQVSSGGTTSISASSSSTATQTSSASSSSDSSTPVSPSSFLSLGAAIGGITLLALIIIGIWLFVRRRRNLRAREQMLQWRPGTLDGGSEMGLPPPTPFVVGQPREHWQDDDARSEDDQATVIMPMSTSPPRKAQMMAAVPPRAARGGTRRYSGQSAAPSYRTNATFIR
ncbi:hypothetical protein C8F01DRAFT_1098279 [Mycena amicta]|nr:hypothetical protein C8F01DRAFT_1098279 [Mycena amicta]